MIQFYFVHEWEREMNKWKVREREGAPPLLLAYSADRPRYFMTHFCLFKEEEVPCWFCFVGLIVQYIYVLITYFFFQMASPRVTIGLVILEIKKIWWNIEKGGTAPCVLYLSFNFFLFFIIYFIYFSSLGFKYMQVGS